MELLISKTKSIYFGNTRMGKDTDSIIITGKRNGRKGEVKQELTVNQALLRESTRFLYKSVEDGFWTYETVVHPVKGVLFEAHNHENSNNIEIRKVASFLELNETNA